MRAFTAHDTSSLGAQWYMSWPTARTTCNIEHIEMELSITSGTIFSTVNSVPQKCDC